MKVALVHDWLTGLRGGEKCLLEFLEIYPEADIFSLIHVPGAVAPAIDQRIKQVSYLQKFPGVKHYYRLLLPFFPSAVRQFNFDDYDLVISVSHAAVKNIDFPNDTKHICYCLTPMRYIWDEVQSYFGKVTPVLWPIIVWLRRWDRLGARRPSHFVAISQFVAARIRCFYDRNADVIFPPVDTAFITPTEHGQPGEAFLWAGALVPYKRPDLVIEAFNKLGLPLWVVGRGPEERRLRKIANPNITFLGALDDSELADRYRRCRALVFPGTEDFGMTPIECMAAGRPVIALHDGAAKETVKGITHWNVDRNSSLVGLGATGVFIERRGSSRLDSLLQSISYFIEHESEFSAEACIAQGRRFSKARFRESWELFLARIGISAPESFAQDQTHYA